MTSWEQLVKFTQTSCSTSYSSYSRQSLSDVDWFDVIQWPTLWQLTVLCCRPWTVACRVCLQHIEVVIGVALFVANICCSTSYSISPESDLVNIAVSGRPCVGLMESFRVAWVDMISRLVVETALGWRGRSALLLWRVLSLFAWRHHFRGFAPAISELLCRCTWSHATRCHLRHDTTRHLPVAGWHHPGIAIALGSVVVCVMSGHNNAWLSIPH